MNNQNSPDTTAKPVVYQRQGETRKQRLPKDWPRRRGYVLKRDKHVCQILMIDGSTCPYRAKEVDHIIAGDDHAYANLQAICNWHHQRKSSSEGGTASWAVYRKRLAAAMRPPEVHPGLLEAARLKGK